MSWKVACSSMLACAVAACAAPEKPSVAKIDAHCSEIATTGDEYRYCVEQGRGSAGLALVQPGDALEALQFAD